MEVRLASYLALAVIFERPFLAHWPILNYLASKNLLLVISSLLIALEGLGRELRGLADWTLQPLLALNMLNSLVLIVLSELVSRGLSEGCFT